MYSWITLTLRLVNVLFPQYGQCSAATSMTFWKPEYYIQLIISFYGPHFHTTYSIRLILNWLYSFIFTSHVSLSHASRDFQHDWKSPNFCQSTIKLSKPMSSVPTWRTCMKVVLCGSAFLSWFSRLFFLQNLICIRHVRTTRPVQIIHPGLNKSNLMDLTLLFQH